MGHWTFRGLRNRPLGGDSVGRCSTVKPSGKNLSENKKSTEDHRRIGRTLRFSIFLFSFSSFFCSYFSRWQRVSNVRPSTLERSNASIQCGPWWTKSGRRVDEFGGTDTSNAMGLVAFPIAGETWHFFVDAPNFPAICFFFSQLLDTCWV